MIVSRVLWTHKVKCCRQSMASLNSDPDKTGKCQQIRDVFLGMGRTVFKKRTNWMTVGILLQLLAYTMYYISFRECKLWYLYVRKTHGWYQEQFITIKVARKLLGIFILMLVLPMLKKFKISDINLLIFFNLLHGIGFFLGSLSMFDSSFLIAGQYSVTV